MAQPYVGEIRLFAGNFAPAGWAACDGALLPISEYETLFNLVGTTYGGDGQSTFALPDLRGRLPVHMGPNFVLAQTGGQEEVTLTPSQIPQHTHAVQVDAQPGTHTRAAGHVPAMSEDDRYAAGTPVPMGALAVGSTGGSQPHTNLMPYAVLRYIISLFGIFPSPT